MRFFGRNKQPQQPIFGIVEAKPIPGILYHAQGRLSNSPGFIHKITLSPISRVVQDSLEDYRRAFTEEILKSLLGAERRAENRQFLQEIFQSETPNAIIRITATPDTASQRLNKDRVLLAAAVRLSKPPVFDTRALIKKVGGEVRFTMESMNRSITEDEAVWMLRYLLLENAITWNWWMMALLRGYLEAIGHQRPR